MVVLRCTRKPLPTRVPQALVRLLADLGIDAHVIARGRQAMQDLVFGPTVSRSDQVSTTCAQGIELDVWLSWGRSYANLVDPPRADGDNEDKTTDDEESVEDWEMS